jgi:hypothetical protein
MQQGLTLLSQVEIYTGFARTQTKYEFPHLCDTAYDLEVNDFKILSSFNIFRLGMPEGMIYQNF